MSIEAAHQREIIKANNVILDVRKQLSNTQNKLADMHAKNLATHQKLVNI
jgi:uncharacterized protein involved in exopolysaccharide biosynthesis